jgi:hypothetical protein
MDLYNKGRRNVNEYRQGGDCEDLKKSRYRGHKHERGGNIYFKSEIRKKNSTER